MVVAQEKGGCWLEQIEFQVWKTKNAAQGDVLYILVARGGIEPPTQGFSILRDLPALRNFTQQNKGLRKQTSTLHRIKQQQRRQNVDAQNSCRTSEKNIS